jgi:hypothetical protein
MFTPVTKILESRSEPCIRMRRISGVLYFMIVVNIWKGFIRKNWLFRLYKNVLFMTGCIFIYKLRISNQKRLQSQLSFKIDKRRRGTAQSHHSCFHVSFFEFRKLQEHSNTALQCDEMDLTYNVWIKVQTLPQNDKRCTGSILQSR